MATHFNFLAPYYDRIIPPADPERLLCLLRLPITGRVLDAGGGTGRASSQLLSSIDHVTVTDLSLPMLQEAQSKGGLHPVQAHVELLPFPDACFDRVLVVDALHHFSDQRGAVRELLRVLKPRGRLVIEEPDIGYLAVKAVALAERLALMGSHFHSPFEIRDMIAAHGLDPRVERGDGFAAWILVDK
jgi:ubiquinone/menaquinone biosynthesis C-methylase UbiE